ncbi:hypothetical protein HDV04_003647 [Boothiomyces sp. JEL0838]|nr:hypothetical protein HDV04_003647 [Boothiomyces sp. JEL0838]
MSNTTVGSSGGVMGTLPDACTQSLSTITTKCYGASSLSTNQIVSAADLDKLCSSDCSSAVSNFKSNLGTCGSQIFDPSSNTNGTVLYSYIELINTFACVKDSGSYCFASEIAAIQAANVSVTGSDAFSNVAQYLTSNLTLLCSNCIQKQFTAISQLNDLDPSIGPSVQSLGTLLNKACGSSTATTASPTAKAGAKAAISSFFAILLPFAVFAASF